MITDAVVAGREEGMKTDPMPCDGVKAVADNGIGAHCFFFGNGSYIFPKYVSGSNSKKSWEAVGEVLLIPPYTYILPHKLPNRNTRRYRRRVVFQFPVVRRRIIGIPLRRSHRDSIDDINFVPTTCARILVRACCMLSMVTQVSDSGSYLSTVFTEI